MMHISSVIPANDTRESMFGHRNVPETSSTRLHEVQCTLDLFFTSNQIFVNKVEVIPGVSGHGAVFIESSLQPMRVKTPPRKVFQYRKADYNAMKIEPRSFQAEFQESAKTNVGRKIPSRYLPVFPGMANNAQVANNGK